MVDQEAEYPDVRVCAHHQQIDDKASSARIR